MEEYFRYEITLDVSDTTKEEFNTICGILVNNGYDVYRSIEDFDANGHGKHICLSIDDKGFHKIKED